MAALKYILLNDFDIPLCQINLSHRTRKIQTKEKPPIPANRGADFISPTLKRESERSEIQQNRIVTYDIRRINYSTSKQTSRGVSLHSGQKLAQTARELCSIFHLNKLPTKRTMVIHDGLAVKIVSAT